MRQPGQYNKIFSESTNLNVWPAIAQVLRITDKIERVRPKRNSNLENYLKSTRYITCLLTLGKLIGKLDFSSEELIAFDISRYTGAEVNSVWNEIQKHLPDVWNKSNWKNKKFTQDVLQNVSQQLSIANYHAIEKRDDTVFEDRHYKIHEIDKEFLERVHHRLPSQPWPMGIHKEIATEFSVPFGKVSQAINKLIEAKVVYSKRMALYMTMTER